MRGNQHPGGAAQDEGFQAKRWTCQAPALRWGWFVEAAVEPMRASTAPSRLASSPAEGLRSWEARHLWREPHCLSALGWGLVSSSARVRPLRPKVFRIGPHLRGLRIGPLPQVHLPYSPGPSGPAVAHLAAGRHWALLAWVWMGDGAYTVFLPPAAGLAGHTHSVIECSLPHQAEGGRSRDTARFRAM